MKTILPLFTTILMLISFDGCVNAQNEDKQIIEMLKEYYTAHYAIWSIKPTPPSDVLDMKLDSLQDKYCTLNLRSKSKDQLNHWQDLLTNDYGIDSLGIKTMSISKDTDKKNVYIVSYTTLNDLVPNTSKTEVKVILRLTIVNEKGALKMDNIE